MKISEVVDALTNAKKQFGDLEILIASTEGMDDLYLLTTIGYRKVPNINRELQDVLVLE